MSSQTIITLTGDEKSAYEAFQKVIAEAAKLETATDKVGKKAKAVKNEFDFAKQGKDAFMEMATSVVSVTGAIGVLQIGLQGVRAEYERINQLGKEQLALGNKVAQAQQEASKNLAGTDPAEMQRLFQESVPRIAIESKFPDLAQITTAIGAAASIIGSDRAETVVSAAAQLTALTPDQLQTTTSATADVTKAIGVSDAREALALLLSTGSVSRPENLPQLATGAAKAINAGVVSTAATQSQLDAAKESAALFAMLSEVDPSGQSAATATVQLISQMRDLFSDLGAQDRDKKAAELANKRERAEEELLRSQIAVEQKTKAAEKFGSADTPEAKVARLAITTTENEVKRLKASIVDMDQELSQLASISQMRSDDPGTTAGRIQAIAGNEAAREFALKNMVGEAVFKPLFEGLLTAGSEQQRKLADAQKVITTDIGVFEKALKTQDLTPQQQTARNLGFSEALTNAQSMADPRLEVASAIKQVRLEAERNFTAASSPLVSLQKGLEGFSLWARGWMELDFDPLLSPESELLTGRSRLQMLIDERPLFRDRTPEELQQVETLRQQIRVMESLMQSLQSNAILGPVATPPAPVQPIQPPIVVQPPEPRNEPNQNRVDQTGVLNPNMTREEISQQLIEARRELAKPALPNTEMEVLKQQQQKLIASLEALAAKIDSNTVSVERNNNILQQDTQTNNSGTIQAQQNQRK